MAQPEAFYSAKRLNVETIDDLIKEPRRESHSLVL